jgi:hypothetical protein
MTAVDKFSYGSIASHENEEETVQSTDDKCTVWQTTFNLISLITGSGMLGLPYAASTMGWSAVFVLLFLAFLFLYCFGLLAEVIEFCIKKQQNENYNEGGACLDKERIRETELSGYRESERDYDRESKIDHALDGEDQGYDLNRSEMIKQNSSDMMSIDFVTLGTSIIYLNIKIYLESSSILLEYFDAYQEQCIDINYISF